MPKRWIVVSCALALLSIAASKPVQITSPTSGDLTVSAIDLEFPLSASMNYFAASEQGYTGSINVASSAGCGDRVTVVPSSGAGPYAAFTVHVSGWGWAGDCYLNVTDDHSGVRPVHITW